MTDSWVGEWPFERTWLTDRTGEAESSGIAQPAGADEITSVFRVRHEAAKEFPGPRSRDARAAAGSRGVEGEWRDWGRTGGYQQCELINAWPDIVVVADAQVYLALKYGVKPMGTIAHEWIMAIGAVYGYKGANGRAMDMWEAGELPSTHRLLLQLILVYPPGPNGAPLTMLTDTFTAQAFFVDFIADPSRALRWGSLRQDSGDPFTFVKQAKAAWKEVEDKAGVDREDGIVAKGKRIIFSDGLDVDKAIALQKGCDELGIGGKRADSFEDCLG